MFIAEKYKESNIVEYVLYMWHIEEAVRSLNLDINRIESEIIDQFSLPEDARSKMYDWYADIVRRMKEQRIHETGHLEELRELMNEIYYLHQSLVTLYQDKEYQRLLAEAKPNLDILQKKSDGDQKSEVELAMNGLFGVLILKLKKREVSEGTQDAVKSISKMMGHLAKQYNKMKLGQLTLPKVMEN